MYIHICTYTCFFSVSKIGMCRLALLLYLVAVCVHSLPSCGATDYYVRPTQPASISCPGQPCLTFSQYANNLSSNATYLFMAGVHVIKGAIEVRNIRNVSLVALERNVDLPQIISECGSSGDTSNGYVECFGIMFKDVRDITISSLILKMPYATTGLTFIDSTGIVIRALFVNITMVKSSPIYIFSILFSNTTDILMNSLIMVNGGIHVTQSRRVDVSNVTLVGGIMNFTQTIDVHIRDIISCDIFDPYTGCTRTSNDIFYVILGNRNVINLLNTFNTTIKNVTICYTPKIGIYMLNTFNTTITNVTICYSVKAGIHLLSSSKTTITSIIILYTERAGIEMIRSSGSTVSNLNVILSEKDCITMKQNQLVKMNDINVTNCNNGIYMEQSQRIEVNALNCSGIFITDTNDINITACTIKCASLLALRVKHSRFIDVKFICGRTYSIGALDLYFVVDTIIKSLTITTTKLTTHTTNIFRGIVLYNCSNVTIAQSIFTNIPSFDTQTSDVAFKPAVITIYYSEENIIIRNCSFEANNITALAVVQSKVRISGKVNFTGNTAFRGAAMTFTQGGKMIVVKDSHITFKKNYARITGGAIYLTTTYTRSDSLKVSTECFIQVEGGYSQYHLTFLNNRAGLGGNELYGGGLQHACNHKCKGLPQKRSYTCLSEFLTVSDIQTPTLSNISSDPSRVCLCVDENPDCLNIFKTIQDNGHGPYPGQTIEISAVVVGQNFGTVSGSVYAQLINSPFSNNTPTLGQGQETQGVNHHSCNNLQYTINSPVENITIMLTSAKLKETYMVSQQTFTETRRVYEAYENNTPYSFFPQTILEFPVYINISLEPCPPGFSITHKHPVTCDCVRQLRELPGVTCDIENVTIYRSGQVWVGQLLKSTFNETDYDHMNVASARYCPFNYCKNDGIKIHLSHSHDQCNYNHSGIVCGECIHDLSLILGSDQCLNCSNTYLLLLLPFAVAGVVLVAFIKLLDITVSSGFINSLIFYTNIVKVNEYIFLPHRTTNPITLFISWFNLDLGIETCFYDGLDAYAKAWLQFVFPFYLWCIAGLIILARYSITFTRLTGNNSVPVLATLFLLSNAKLLRNVITILSYTTVDTAQGQKVVWSADGNIDYLGPQHVPLFTAAIATLVLLWLPYTTLFLCGQWVCTINLSFITRMSMKLKPFLDAHYGPLTDKHRYWFGILLGVRIVILLISVAVPASNFSISAFSVCIAAGALVSYMAIGPPLYRNKHVAMFEVFLFINLGLLGLTKFYVVSTDGNQTAATLTLLTVVFVQFLGLVLYRIYSTLKPLFTQYYQRLHNKEEEEEDEIDGEQREGVLRYDTSTRELEESQNLTPYRDAATAL